MTLTVTSRTATARDHSHSLEAGVHGGPGAGVRGRHEGDEVVGLLTDPLLAEQVAGEVGLHLLPSVAVQVTAPGQDVV